MNTPLYADCEVAHAFGKWPHEFYALDPLEQEVCRWYFRLHREKEAYAMRSKQDRQYWPNDPPPGPPHH